jgi:hypothetical protein
METRIIDKEKGFCRFITAKESGSKSTFTKSPNLPTITVAEL